MSVKQPIPLFPLNTFLLPGERRELYIFEDRYKQLVEDCLNEGTPFGIAFSNKSNTENYGCLVDIVAILHQYPSGEMDIVIEASTVFQLKQFFLQQDGKMYPAGRIAELPERKNYPASESLIEKYRKFQLKHDSFVPAQAREDSSGIFNIAEELGLSDMEKLELVEEGSARMMNRYLINYIEYLNLLYQQENSVFQNIYLN